jgi:hypothetical protein
MMRQIIGIFDEYTSKENGKNVTRAMKENAKQGLWNGASAPLGYSIVEAERRGQKIKKHLAVEPFEAETVRLIFRLYVEGDTRTGTPPLGYVQHREKPTVLSRLVLLATAARHVHSRVDQELRKRQPKPRAYKNPPSEFLPAG